MGYSAEYKKQYDSTRRDEIRAYQKLYRERNLSKAKQKRDATKGVYPTSLYAKRSYLKHGDKIRSQAKAYRLANPEKVAAMKKRWYAENPGATAVASTNNRVRRLYLMAGARIKKSDFEDMKVRFLGLCAYCGQKKTLGMDHVIPLSRGGPHIIENIMPACRSCNSRKQTKTAAEFMPEKYGMNPQQKTQ